MSLAKRQLFVRAAALEFQFLRIIIDSHLYVDHLEKLHRIGFLVLFLIFRIEFHTELLPTRTFVYGGNSLPVLGAAALIVVPHGNFSGYMSSFDLQFCARDGERLGRINSVVIARVATRDSLLFS